MGTKDRWTSRQTAGTGGRRSGTEDMPSWVGWFTDWGRPVVAVIVMVMCAPGEHHLAVMAGWSDRLAWGMPSCLVFYTGIAAVVATKRSRNAPGKRTAVVGAVTALLLAMSAQPVSHMFVTGHWDGDPWPLVVVVSCIPPLVLGHLLHLAAGAGPVRSRVPSPVPVPVHLPQDVPSPSAGAVPEVPQDVPVPVPVPAAASLPSPVLAASPVLRPRNIRSGTVASLVQQWLEDNPDADTGDRDVVRTIVSHVRDVLPQAAPNTIRKNVYRARGSAA